jgi:hypothetical protein
VDSSASIAPIDSQIVNKNWVAADSEILTETPFKGEVCIQKRSQPLLTQKKVNENWVGVDWEIVNETSSKGDA